MRTAKKMAEAATRAKSEFLANMSHEIRTPVMAILGFAENLLDPDISASDRVNACQTIQRNGEYLLHIINDILDLSKIEADKMMLDRVACSVCQIIAEVASLVRVRAQAKGLTISKRLARMLGGDITVVESKPGVGTHFRATVACGPLDGIPLVVDPLSATHAASEPHGPTAAPQVPTLGNCRILLAEDGPHNRRLIAHILKVAGADVTMVENGRQAIDAALAASDHGAPFDVILMDMQMPITDGYEAARTLRRQGYTRPIIALTAHSMATDRDKCLEAGCDDYASKPIDRRQLIEIVRRHLLSDASATPVTSSPSKAAPMPSWVVR